MPCYTLFHTAVMFGDGSVAPCRGSFYAPDDMGRVAADGRPGASSFKAVWNNERFRLARRFFSEPVSARQQATAPERQHICFECPALLDWHHFAGFQLAGGKFEDWVPPHDSNVRYNYFWGRKRYHETTLSARHQPSDPETDN
jgi:hypothetical protein